MYGQVSYDITSALEATVAVRCDQNDYDSTQYDSLELENPIPTPDGIVTQRSKDTAVQPKFQLAYRRTDDVMTYATVAKGVRSGFYYSGNSTKPESTWNYELGLKSSLLGHRVRCSRRACRPATFRSAPDARAQSAPRPRPGNHPELVVAVVRDQHPAHAQIPVQLHHRELPVERRPALDIPRRFVLRASSMSAAASTSKYSLGRWRIQWRNVASIPTLVCQHEVESDIQQYDIDARVTTALQLW